MRRPRKKLKVDEEAAPSKPLTPEEARQRTFQRAVKLLAARSRSEAELRELLLQRRASSKADVEEAIERLREYGYLDDERFAFGYASLKLRQRPLGRQRLKRDLKMKKVDQATIDEALDLAYAEVSEEELIDQAIEKRIRTRGRPKTRVQAQSLFQHLMRQGFPLDLVSEKVRALSTPDSYD